jgi:thiosulfate/3-mercaptopyruvate sulfurtransferase
MRRAWVFAALLFAAPAASAQSTATPAIPPAVTTEWLAAEMARPGLVVLQLSSAESFAAAHIPGSVILDFAGEIVAPPTEGGLRTELPAAEALQRTLRAKGVSDDSRLVVVFDQPNAFTRASRAFFTLEWAGLAGRVAVLDGGLPKWRREGRAVATGTGRIVRPGGVTLDPQPARRATVADVLAAIADPDARILDARDSVFYRDTRSNGMPRGGHIASAVSLPFSTVTANDGTLKPRAELEALVRGAGIGDDERVVSYCHIGMQASWMYFTLRVLGRDVRMFDGSFDEWSRDAGLPVEGERPREP